MNETKIDLFVSASVVYGQGYDTKTQIMNWNVPVSRLPRNFEDVKFLQTEVEKTLSEATGHPVDTVCVQIINWRTYD